MVLYGCNDIRFEIMYKWELFCLLSKYILYTIYKLHISPALIMGLRNMNGNPWDFIIMVISGQRGVFNYWILVNDS